MRLANLRNGDALVGVPDGRPKKEGRGGFGGCEDRDEREEPGEPRQRLHGPHRNPAQTPSGSTDAVGEGAEAAVAAEPARFSGAFAAALLEMTKKPGDVGRPGSRKFLRKAYRSRRAGLTFPC